jgi:restriction system protein
MKNYYRVMLGAKSKFAQECYKQGFLGVDFSMPTDFTGKFGDNWRDFNKEFIPFFLKNNPKKTKIAAGLACGMTWTVCQFLQDGDIILCPDGNGNYMIGTISGGYFYKENECLPHRRKVVWDSKLLDRGLFSIELQNSAGAISTAVSLSKYSDEIECLIESKKTIKITANDDTIEDPSVFALEKHLEDFLVQNWKHTDIGKNYNIYEIDGEQVGKQFPTDSGPIDILAVSKDSKELLIVELKRGRASDVVVGQILRYMGYVKEDLADNSQKVKGVIIAFEDDIKLRRALSVTQNIEFYTYKISFKLEKK